MNTIFNMIRLSARYLVCALAFAGSSGQSYAEETSPDMQMHEQFFETVKSFCGARFEGEMTFPVDGQDSFAGKLLVANVAECTEEVVRIPFIVGEDQSRTWIISKHAGSLQLKHDHRHPDGTPDEVTMYGGMATSGGSARSLSFAADAHTAEIIPAARTNVWSIKFNPQGDQLTYHLERNSAPRFTAVLNLVQAPHP